VYTVTKAVGAEVMMTIREILESIYKFIGSKKAVKLNKSSNSLVLMRSNNGNSWPLNSFLTSDSKQFLNCV
jgi:hypothetical protein